MYNTIKEIKSSNITIINEVSYQKKDIKIYIKMFDAYLMSGVISKESKFEDLSWRITNEVQNKKIEFILDEVKFKHQNSKRHMGLDYNDIILSLKFFTLLLIQNNSIASISRGIRDITWILEETDYFDIDKIVSFRKSIKENGGISHLDDLMKIYSYIDFFECIIVPDKYYFLFESLHDSNSQTSPRALPTFESMFKFDEIIERFIAEASDEEKEKYYPIILWWKITSQIPLRSTEFTLIPYNCIINSDNKLIIRRTNEKGRKSADHYEHSIEGGYYIDKIAVNEEIIELINNYKLIVDKYDLIENFYGDARKLTGERKYLLSFRSYYKFSQKKSKSLSTYIFDYFSIRQLYALINSFFIKIVSKSYILIEKLSNNSNAQKGSEKKHANDLLPYQIEFIQPMDTRHFAVMNMILSDIPPVAVKVLAGHKDIVTTYHYYDHIESFVHSYTYHLAKKYTKNESKNYNILDTRIYQTPVAKTEYHLPLIKSGEIKAKEVENGWCTYEKDDFSPCKKYDYECNKGCRYYIPDKQGVENIEQIVNKENYREINSSIQVIKELIRDRKIIKNFDERIRTEISKINSYAEQNSLIIKEHMIKRFDEVQNGEKQEEKP